MSIGITVEATASASNGANDELGQIIQVDAVEEIQETVVKNSVPLVVAVHPVGVVVDFLSITAERYTDLTLTVGTGSPIDLSAPLLLQGADQVSLLGADTSEITFENSNITEDNEIKILVGRGILAGN